MSRTRATPAPARPRTPQGPHLRRNRFLSILGVVALSLSAVGLFVPSAAAQDQRITVDSRVLSKEGQPVLPDSGKAVLELRTTVTVSAGAGCVVPIKVTWTKGAIPPYATMVFNPVSESKSLKADSAPLPVAEPGGSVLTFDTRIQVSVNRGAPAFQDGSYEVIVKVEAGQVAGGSACNIDDPEDTRIVDVVRNGYLPLTHVSPGSLHFKAGQNKKIAIPVDILNMGNGPTRVRIELAPAGKNRLDSMNAGGEIRLESQAGRGAGAIHKMTRYIEVQTPHSTGYENSIYAFTARFHSGYDGPTQDKVATDETSMTFTVQVQGVHVPGFDVSALLIAGGVGLAGLGLSRRRR